jgi:hypothetical protein
MNLTLLTADQPKPWLNIVSNNDKCSSLEASDKIVADRVESNDSTAVITLGSNNIDLLANNVSITGNVVIDTNNVEIGANAAVIDINGSGGAVAIGKFATTSNVAAGGGVGSVVIGDSAASNSIGNVVIGQNAASKGVAVDNVIVGKSAGATTTGRGMVVVGAEAAGANCTDGSVYIGKEAALDGGGFARCIIISAAGESGGPPINPTAADQIILSTSNVNLTNDPTGLSVSSNNIKANSIGVPSGTLTINGKAKIGPRPINTGGWTMTGPPIPIVNTTATISMISTGIGSLTTPANTVSVGSTSFGSMGGTLNALNGATLNLFLTINGVSVIAFAHTFSNAVSLPGSGWTLKTTMVCVADGPGGTIRYNSIFYYRSDLDLGKGEVQDTSFAFDTTSAATFGMTGRWGAASPSNSIQMNSHYNTNVYQP